MLTQNKVGAQHDSLHGNTLSPFSPAAQRYPDHHRCMLTQWSSARSSVSSHGRGEQWSWTQRQPCRGWPSAIVPPLTLVLSRSSPNSFSTERNWAAKASFTCTQKSILVHMHEISKTVFRSRENVSYSFFCSYTCIHVDYNGFGRLEFAHHQSQKFGFVKASCFLAVV